MQPDISGPRTTLSTSCPGGHATFEEDLGTIRAALSGSSEGIMHTGRLATLERHFIGTAATIEIIFEPTIEDDRGLSIGPNSEIGKDGAGVTLHELPEAVSVRVDHPNIPVAVAITLKDERRAIRMPGRP